VARRIALAMPRLARLGHRRTSPLIRRRNAMARSQRQKIEELKAENEELQEIIEDYEQKFDAIAEQLPEEEDKEEEGE
jgi:cell division protein FtsB